MDVLGTYFTAVSDLPNIINAAKAMKSFSMRLTSKKSTSISLDLSPYTYGIIYMAYIDTGVSTGRRTILNISPVVLHKGDRTSNSPFYGWNGSAVVESGNSEVSNDENWCAFSCPDGINATVTITRANSSYEIVASGVILAF